MPANKSALIRYKVIDECLRNIYKKWTLADLVDAVSDALYEYEGIQDGVSYRTIQQDIQTMRSDKLGYNAPIVVFERKYYKYEDKDYSITNLPISSIDLDKMNEAVGILKQFKGFSYFSELTEMITKLESKVYSTKSDGASFIQFEKNDLLKGLNFINPIHKSIIERKATLVEYKSFKADKSQQIIFIPYLLKEYRNRWFVLGVNKKSPKNYYILALDRISQVEPLSTELYIHADEDFILNYFDDVLGVSKTPRQRASTIVLKINKSNYPYIVTKPLHPSQKVLKEMDDGVIFEIQVIWNFELEREILGFGEGVKVLSPQRLQKKIKHRLIESSKHYE
ncbi:WYL domain-containing protein [Candidatus Kapabacteria bacterium]|nr:WYL domain-containing protein [Candidatus Kapabacteria bacterium]